MQTMACTPRARCAPRACRREPSGGHRKQSKEENYHAKMRLLMRALTGRNYQPGHKCSRRELKSTTPDKIAHYIKERVYGDAEARPDDDPLIHLRCNTILI